MKTINYTLTLLISFSAIPTLASDGGSYNAERKAEFSEATNAIQEGPELLFDAPEQYEQYAAQKSDNTLNRALQLQACKSVQEKLAKHADIDKDLVKTICWMKQLSSPIKKLIFKELHAWKLDQILGKHGQSVSCLCLTRLNHLISGSSDGLIKVWDLQKNTLLYTLYGHTGPINAFQLTVDGRLISASDDATIKIWDLDAKVCIHTMRGHKDKIKALKLINDNELLSGSYDGTIKKWDLENLRCLQTSYNLEGPVHHIEIKPYNEFLVGHHTPIIHSNWDSTTLTDLSVDHDVINLEYKGIDPEAFTDFWGGTCSITPDYIGLSFHRPSWNHDRYSELGYGRQLHYKHDGYIKVINLTNNMLLRKIPIGSDYEFTSLTLTGDNKIMGCNGGCVLVYDIKLAHRTQTLAAHNNEVTSICMIDNNKMITSSKDGTIKIWKKDVGLEEQAFFEAEQNDDKKQTEKSKQENSLSKKDDTAAHNCHCVIQ